MENLEQDYDINDGLIKLREITEVIRCKNCNKILTVKGKDSWLFFKNSLVCNFSEGTITIKCPECKLYTTITVKNKKTSLQKRKIS